MKSTDLTINVDLWTLAGIIVDYSMGDTTITQFDSQTNKYHITTKSEGYFLDSTNWTFGMGYDTDGGPTYDNWFVGFIYEVKIYPYARTSDDLLAEIACTTCD